MASNSRLLLGMVHLPPLPGSPGVGDQSPEQALPRALEVAAEDARRLIAGGMDGFFLENFNDHPFYPDQVPPVTLAAMTWMATKLKELPEVREKKAFIGVNVLRNDASSALALAAVVGCDAIRVNVHTGAMVTDQGVIEGQAHATIRERARLRVPVRIFADVLVKHASPLGVGSPDIGSLARETAGRGRADALIVTGQETGAEADLDQIARVREAVEGTPILVGSGVSADSVAKVLKVADGVIIGTGLKEDGQVHRAVDVERVKALVAAARG